jgi:glycosyltransferase involved in cell wall biosynthesis
MTALSIVVPCFNEEAVLPETSKRLSSLMDRLQAAGKITSKSSIYFVDDGSSDRTWSVIEELAKRDPRVHGIKLSKNRGHQNALLAGLMTVGGDAIVSIDADLQDDVDVVQDMVDAHLTGKDIVYGVRNQRRTDTLFKRRTAEFYYNLLRWMGVDVIFNHADYRLMSRRALDALKEYSEVNLFLRGVIPTIGFSSAVVIYDRKERYAGESKYHLRKMLALAVDGITSFSTFPLRCIAGLGIVIFLISLLLSFWVIWIRYFSPMVVPGWASSVLPMYLLGGIQLFSIGILGEYVSKIYMETKRRPRFIIEKEV